MTKNQKMRVVKNALSNERLEGGDVSEFAQNAANDYVAGKISAKEAATKIRSRYGVK